MKLSQLFTKTQKTSPVDVDSINAKLLTQAGFIAKQAAGIYNFLPLGLKVLNKIQNIIREEMDAIGGQEIVMSALCQEESWQKTNRAGLDILFHLQGRGEAKFVLSPTHEETITPLMKQFISSYRDLPFSAYQFQRTLRNEPRAKSGIMRGREFLMKDLYSFHADENDLNGFYKKAMNAYFKIFQRVGLAKQTILTFASGGSFSKFSHEFQTICKTGEDTIYLCPKCNIAVNEEIIKEQTVCPECGNKNLEIKKSAEVGNIFKLRTKFSEPFNLTYKNEKGEDKLVEMGCYGIGLSRIMGVIAEIFNDAKGLIWPDSVAPFQAHLIAVENDQKIIKEAEKLYQQLTKQGIKVLFDDRAEVTAGEKFADADLIGIPNRLIISQKTLAKNSAELKPRNSQTTSLIKLTQLAKKLTN